MKVSTGKLYKRASLFSLSLALVVSGLSVAVLLYLSQIVHATPAPAPILTLTVPATKTITRSALVPETNGTASDAVVKAAISGLTAIPVTLANTGDATSANVRINPINAGAHIQLWAKDTSNNWFDINVTGWIDSAGKSIPANSGPITTNVYAISDVAGSYPLTVNLVNAVGGATVTSTTGTVTVTPIIYTIYSQTDFAAFDGVGIKPVGTNFYTVSPGITATYTSGTGTEIDPVNLTLTGYAPIVTPWFGLTWTTHNYVTVGIKLPTGFTRTSVYDAGVIRYDDLTHYPDGYYSMGNGSTDLATAGGASGYLDYSFAADSTNTKKDGLVKLQVIWTAGGTPEYFTIDISDLSTLPDTTPPNVPANGLPNNSYKTTNDFNFTWDASTDNRPSPVTYEFQSSLNPAQSGGVLTTGVWPSGILPSNTIHSTGAPDGTWYWQVRAVDAANNKSAWSPIWNVTLDTKAPVVPTHLSPADGIHTTTADLTKVDWSDVTDSSTPVSYFYQSSYSNTTNQDGSFTSPAYSSGALTASEIPTPGTPEGNYYWHVRAGDAVGNSSAWSSLWQFTVDNTSPTANFIFPTPGPSSKSFEVQFSEAVNQADAENSTNYFLNNWPGAGGSGNLVDHANISYDSTSHIATITFTTPGWSISPEQQWGVRDVHDLAGNIQSPNSYAQYSTPMVKPVTTDSGTDSNWHNSAVTVSLPCTDVNGSGCKNTYYTTDGNAPTTSSTSGNSIILNSDGIYTIKYFSVDNAGNVEDVKTAVNVVKIGTAAPVIPVTGGDFTIVVLHPITSPDGLITTPLTTTPQTTDTTTNAGGGAVADTTGQALGDQTSKANTNDKGTVKGDSTTKNNDNTWSFLGLAWYWWLLILAAVASAWWAFSAIRNRRDI